MINTISCPNLINNDRCAIDLCGNRESVPEDPHMRSRCCFILSRYIENEICRWADRENRLPCDSIKIPVGINRRKLCLLSHHATSEIPYNIQEWVEASENCEKLWGYE